MTGRVGRDEHGLYIRAPLSPDNPTIVKIPLEELFEDLVDRHIRVTLADVPPPSSAPPTGDPPVDQYAILVNLLAATDPVLTFRGSTRDDWEQWRSRFRAALLEHLGAFPPRVPLAPRVVERGERPGVTIEKVVLQTGPHAALPCLLMIPADLAPGERRAAILAAHGHGGNKEQLAGLQPSLTGYEKYGIALAREGYVVLAPDWRGFGERQFPEQWVRSNRDPCNVGYLAFGYFGYHLLTLNLHDARRCLDYLASRPEVDAARLGMVGLSFGGTMTTYTTAIDDRVRAACISGYVSTLQDALSFRGLGNTCGSQFSPGLLTYGTIADVAGLIAPRPLFVEMGQRDQCFILEDARRAYQHVERIYAAAGAAGQLQKHAFPGTHQFHGARSVPWLLSELPPVAPS